MNAVVRDVLTEAEALYRLAQDFTKICKCDPNECGGGRDRIILLEEENALLKSKLRDCQGQQRSQASEVERLADELKRTRGLLDVERHTVAELKSKIDNWGRDGDPERQMANLRAELDDERRAHTALIERYERDVASAKRAHDGVSCRCGTIGGVMAAKGVPTRSDQNSLRQEATNLRQQLRRREEKVADLRRSPGGVSRVAGSSSQEKKSGASDSFGEVEERIRKIKERANSKYENQRWDSDRASGSGADVTCCKKKTVTTTTCKTNPEFHPRGQHSGQVHVHGHTQHDHQHRHHM